MKKKLILCLLLIPVITGCREKTGEEIEEELEQLKVYQTLVTQAEPEQTESGIPPVTEVIPPESEESEETPETLPPETETLPVTQAETSPPPPPAMTLDFPALWKVNPDICAWIEIPGTKVDYPILQSPDNDDEYLTTAYDGSYYIGGSLFTQATYNNRDFNDPVTVVYGHTMRAGTLFGQLQTVYTSADSFAQHSEITLYLPGEVRKYTVFAAVPMEPIHLLHTYDFSNNYWYKNFFNRVYAIRAFGANFHPEIRPEPGDRVIILSTCLNEDSTQRFLVMAIQQENIP